MIDNFQPAILAPAGDIGRIITFRLERIDRIPEALGALRDGLEPAGEVAGMGEPLTLALRASIPGLRTFPAISGPGCSVPSTQEALCVILRGASRSAIFDRAQRVREMVAPAFAPAEAVDTFIYRDDRDLTGFSDGTENPKGDDAVAAAIVAEGKGLAGSSFVAVQRWVHDLERFRAIRPPERDAIIGRKLETNEEMADAPPSAHVPRTAQESFDPPAFMVRRSMPWATVDEAGLEFIAYVESLDRFERMMRRMAGYDDNIVDALFTVSRPVSGGYYWCPPREGGRLDLSLLGI